MSDSTPTTALVRVRQYGGTYLAGAKIGNARQINASCTAGEKTAAKRAAAKAFGCDEDEIELKGVTSSSTAVFWATQKVSLPEVAEGVEVDFTGLPMDPFNPASWKSK